MPRSDSFESHYMRVLKNTMKHSSLQILTPRYQALDCGVDYLRMYDIVRHKNAKIYV